jgi:hypothetical protein
MTQPKLTDAQKKVMKWLGHGWEAQPGAGSTIIVNGQRICNTDTMKALERAGYAEVDLQRCWKATTAGKSVTGRLCL